MSGPAAAAKASVNANSQLASSAYKALAEGDPATAIASYSQAIESRQLEPEVLANALLNRGLAYQHLNQHDLAVADYTAALRIDAMSAKLRAMALYNRGLSFQRLEQPARAEEDFTSALFLDQEFANAYYSRGMVLSGSGQFLFALADFEKALQFKYPDAARVYFGEALAYDGLKRPAESRGALTKALAANPQYEPARVRLAALDGKVAAPPASGSSDAIETASITDDAATAAAQAAPPTQVAVATIVPAKSHTRKTIYDRVPQEDAPAAAAPGDIAQASGQQAAIEPVSDAPASAAPDQGDDQQTADASATSSDTGSDTADQSATAEPAAATGWTVQVASAQSEEGAWSTFKNIQSRHPVLAGRKPVVVRADLGAKGTFYRVRFTGFDDQTTAQSTCAKFKSGGVSCFVSRAES